MKKTVLIRGRLWWRAAREFKARPRLCALWFWL